MEFHLNGFRPGDPRDHRRRSSAPAPQPLPSTTDVLIVGCGPAGLMLATQLAKIGDISVVIIDEKTGPIELGQADGISGRSLEIFQALGFEERVLKEAYFLQAITFWNSDSDAPERLVRRYKKPDGRTVYSQFPHVVLNQARVHDFLLESMARSPSELTPHYGVKLADLQIQTGNPQASHPVLATVTAQIPGADNDSGALSSIQAKYVVGCDGARSTVRRHLGIALEGDAANSSWGVMDLLALTDFPDVRMKSIIQSSHHGNIMIIPREGGHLLRIYVELAKLKEGARLSRDNVSVEQLIDNIKKILFPFTFEVKEIVWWSVYEVGQRLARHFDSRHLSSEEADHPHGFIAGDACHTHSPKAGQGMNISMHDAFNLGWKLAAVLQGRSPPAILHTYTQERRRIAQELIDFDRELAQLFSASTGEEGSDDAGSPLQQALLRADGYVSGTLNTYGTSLLTSQPTMDKPPTNLQIGKRLSSLVLARLADARPMHLSEALTADGRWRLILFIDDASPAQPTSRLRALASWLADNEASPLLRTQEPPKDIDAVIEVLTVLQAGYETLEFKDFPDLLWPSRGTLKLRDYNKLFCPQSDALHPFDYFGIDRSLGCAVIVRPDQHVAACFALDDTAAIQAFFEHCLRYRS